MGDIFNVEKELGQALALTAELKASERDSFVSGDAKPPRSAGVIFRDVVRTILRWGKEMDQPEFHLLVFGRKNGDKQDKLEEGFIDFCTYARNLLDRQFDPTNRRAHESVDSAYAILSHLICKYETEQGKIETTVSAVGQLISGREMNSFSVEQRQDMALAMYHACTKLPDHDLSDSMAFDIWDKLITAQAKENPLLAKHALGLMLEYHRGKDDKVRSHLPLDPHQRELTVAALTTRKSTLNCLGIEIVSNSRKTSLASVAREVSSRFARMMG